jgi:hypothetical protein
MCFQGLRWPGVKELLRKIVMLVRSWRLLCFGQASVPVGCEPDAVGSSSWGTLVDSMDMKCFLMGLSDKDHASLDPARVIQCWRQEIACEKLV